MLTGVRVLMVGGDARQVEIMSKLCDLDANLTIVGFDRLQDLPDGALQATISEQLFEQADVLLLPAAGMDSSGMITAVFSDTQVQLDSVHLEKMPKEAVIYTGVAGEKLRQLAKQHQLRLVELFERDDVAIYNSIPTAEGALMLAMEHTDITIHGSKAVVLGFGRTGITMARILQAVGAKTSVGVRRTEHFARAVEMGFDAFYTRDLQGNVGNIDLLFNTIPTMIVTSQVIANLPSRAVIIDLASRPGGTDFRYAQKRGVKALLAPGLPGIVAPKTAGRILAECLAQLLLEDCGKRGSDQ